MSKAVIILSDIKKIDKNDLSNSFIVGADRGALNAINLGIKVDIAIGDFDSVTIDEYEFIKKNSNKVIKLNPIKDKSDTLEAIELLKSYDEIVVLGGIKGKRIEHFYANLICLYNNPNVSIKDEYSLIETKDVSFIPNLDYKYVSLFSIEDESIISISGMKYNLSKYKLKKNDPLGLSNEVKDNPYIEIDSGRLLVIYSVNDHENL